MIKTVDRAKFWFVFCSGAAFLVSYIIRLNLSVALFLVCLSAYVKSRQLDAKNHNFLNLLLLFLITFTSGYLIITRNLPVYFIPFLFTPMLATLLFGRLEVSLVLALASAVSLGSISRYPLQTALLFLVGGILSSLLVRGARVRSKIIGAGLAAGIAQSVVALFMHPWVAGGIPSDILFLAVNGAAVSIVVLGGLPVFEYLFRAVTNISLLELADFNHPLMQRMIMEAPGTYHHSLVVGNLSEAACRAVGANSLLARIGAYYHDVGKLSKPEYFSENQDIDGSKHDDLSPAMSKIVIMNHVKEGVEVAKKYKLNPALVDFIQQHHGNSLVYYFYRRALETIEEDQGVREEGFRYQGPKPDTKETAVVLLADSVEAATRALKETSSEKIKETVHKVINNKFIDGQLDECELTLKDLEKISAIFIRILGGIYHGRIKYPEEAISEDSHKKSPKEDSHQSEKDKKRNS